MKHHTKRILMLPLIQYGYSEDHDVDLGYIVTPDEMKEAAFQLYRKQRIEKRCNSRSSRKLSKSISRKRKCKTRDSH
ncbi:hypothetical protein [Oceanobacillus sp. FSL H7-0719]|uniref:hypothetical protein n=1 Tax=Oceanobacillus sp. FSL H7-0719 TaxID=2954507 RepID=UPI00324308F5